MKPIITVENLGKRYTLGTQTAKHSTFRELLAALPGQLYKKSVRSKGKDFWALREVGFTVMPGERVGIIGRNGAGKSTLLKLLSRITEPTKGRIVIRGRVASLLEVGTGFHPELSGRENIYLNGAILGMNRSEVSRKFDEIVDFAGIANFLDTPVKRYSSGMYVRLGFAVAAHLEPEILIVDEVLAVGDVAFQKKCLGKMEEISSGQGRTVLFVSHNMAMVNSLCQRALLLDEGEIAFSGTTSDATNMYYGNSTGIGSSAYYAPRPEESIGDEFIQMIDAAVEDECGTVCSDLSITAPCSLRLRFRVTKKTDRHFVTAFYMYRGDGTLAFPMHSQATQLSEGEHSVACRIPGNFLNDGTHSVTVALLSFEPYSIAHIHEENRLVFTVNDPLEGVPTRGGYPRAMPGAVRPLFTWHME